MNLLYWGIEYAKVLFSYALIIVIWPSIVFSWHLRKRSITYKLGFFFTVPVLIYSTVVLMLGIFGVLYQWLICVLFYGSMAVAVGLRFLSPERFIDQLYLGILKPTQVIHLLWRKTHESLASVREKLKKDHKRLDYFLLFLLVIYAMIYFSYGNFVNTSYGFGDENTHHSWITGLLNGKAFSAGIYPENMHCMVYMLRVVAGCDVYSTLLFLGCIHISLFIVSAYMLLREVFRWKYSAHLVLLVFLTLKSFSSYGVVGMSRLQCTLPQDYGFYLIFVCGAFLIRYMNRKKAVDENLLIISAGVASVIGIHFYSAIMAAVLCGAIALSKFGSLFRSKHFISLIGAVMIGLFVSVAPMAIAYAMGTPLQGSLNWAMNLMEGVGISSRIQNVEEIDEAIERQTAAAESESIVPEAEIASSAEQSPQDQVTDFAETGENMTVTPVKQGIGAKISSLISWVTIWINRCVFSLTSYGFYYYYTTNVGIWVLRIMGIAALLRVLYLLSGLVLHFLPKIRFRMPEIVTDNDLAMALGTLLFMFLYIMPLIGLPEIISGSRLAIPILILGFIMLVMPIDVLMSTLKPYTNIRLQQTIALASIVLYMVCILTNDQYHRYMYMELTRYNAAVNVTNSIANKLPEKSFTILSTTDEYQKCAERGYHEEIITLINAQQYSTDFRIPTKYIFIYVEKKPIQFAQLHYTDGPAWLARSIDLSELDPETSTLSPHINAGQISQEEASMELPTTIKAGENYQILPNRVRWESHLMAWVNRFKEVYPDAIRLYYEDENFVCYCITQTEECPYNLVLP